VNESEGDGLSVLFLALTVDVGAFQGDSTHVIELVSNLRRIGHRVRWIARDSGGRKMWPDPFFHRVSRIRKPANDFLRLLQLLLSMAKGAYYIFRYTSGCDLIYSRDRFSLLLALLPSKLMKKPIVYEVNGLTSEQRKMHGDYLLNRLYVWLLETLDAVAFRNAARAVCVTDAIRNFYSERRPEFAGKLKTVNNGVSTELFHSLPVDGDPRLSRRIPPSGS
jgi:glycosyltransferase involved in cell wall biosynthesis